MSVLKFKGHTKSSGANVSYITRDSACDSISFHNLDDLEANDHYDNKVNALSYAYNREEEETEGRTHYRVTLSWEGKEATDRARAMTHEFLGENFKDSRAIAAIHQDTDQTHAHIWVDARQLDERKLHSPKDHVNQLCKSWQEQYDREYDTARAPEFERKRAEMRQWREDKHNGIDRPKPERGGVTQQQWREKDERDRGVKSNGIDESSTGRDQRPFAVRDSKAEQANRGIAGSQQQLEKSERSIEQSSGNLKQSNQRIERAQRAIANLQSRAGEVDERFDELHGRVSEINRGRDLEAEARKIGEGLRDRSRAWRAKANPDVFGKDADKNKDRDRER